MILSVSHRLHCIADSWEAVNESTDSFASFKDARTALTSKRPGNDPGVSSMWEGGASAREGRCCDGCEKVLFSAMKFSARKHDCREGYISRTKKRASLTLICCRPSGDLCHQEWFLHHAPKGRRAKCRFANPRAGICAAGNTIPVTYKVSQTKFSDTRADIYAARNSFLSRTEGMAVGYQLADTRAGIQATRKHV